MKGYKMKYMTEAQIAEINKLGDDGHAEALLAYSWECANAGVTGYRRGYAIGSGLVLLVIGLGVGVSYAAYKIYEKRALKRTYEAGKEAAKENKK